MNYLKWYQMANGLVADGIVGKNTAAFMMQDFGISDPVKFANFIGQIKVESKNFTAGRENLNYSYDGLLKTFSKYFNKATAFLYARKPEAIANRVYANRMGNRDEKSGDGWYYRGAGAIQLTGADNIKAYFKSCGLSLGTDPDVILEPKHYFKSALWFFDTNNVWYFCGYRSKEGITLASKKINLGNAYSGATPNGIDERIAATKDMINVMGLA